MTEPTHAIWEWNNDTRSWVGVESGPFDEMQALQASYIEQSQDLDPETWAYVLLPYGEVPASPGLEQS